MTEKEMEDLLWLYPEKFFHEPLKQSERQLVTEIGRPDLIFEDQFGRLLVVEVKKGTLGRDAMAQVLDYFGAVKKKYPDRPVEKVLVANVIPPERRLALEPYHIECKEIPEFRFRDVAQEMGYEFESERSAPVSATGSDAIEQPIRQPVSADNDEAATRREWEEQGFGRALAVVDACFEIVSEIDPSLTPVYRVYDEKKGGGKIRKRRFVIPGVNSVPICPSGILSDDHPLRLELTKEKGSIKLSSPSDLIDEWKPKLKEAKLPVSDRTGRLVVVPLWVEDVHKHCEVFRGLFLACLGWWRDKH